MSDKKIIIYIFLNGKSSSIPERLKIYKSDVTKKFEKHNSLYTYKNKLLYKTDGRLFALKDLTDELVLVAVEPCKRFIRAPYNEIFVKFIRQPSTTDTITTCKSNISQRCNDKICHQNKKRSKSCSSINKIKPLPPIKQHDCLKEETHPKLIKQTKKKKSKCCSCCRKNKKLKVRLQRPITSKNTNKYPKVPPIRRSNTPNVYCDRCDHTRKVIPKDLFEPSTLHVHRSGALTSDLQTIAIQTSFVEFKNDLEDGDGQGKILLPVRSKKIIKCSSAKSKDSKKSITCCSSAKSKESKTSNKDLSMASKTVSAESTSVESDQETVEPKKKISILKKPSSKIENESQNSKNEPSDTIKDEPGKQKTSAKSTGCCPKKTKNVTVESTKEPNKPNPEPDKSNNLSKPKKEPVDPKEAQQSHSAKSTGCCPKKSKNATVESTKEPNKPNAEPDESNNLSKPKKEPVDPKEAQQSHSAKSTGCCPKKTKNATVESTKEPNKPNAEPDESNNLSKPKKEPVDPKEAQQSHSAKSTSCCPKKSKTKSTKSIESNKTKDEPIHSTSSQQSHSSKSNQTYKKSKKSRHCLSKSKKKSKDSISIRDSNSNLSQSPKEVRIPLTDESIKPVYYCTITNQNPFQHEVNTTFSDHNNNNNNNEKILIDINLSDNISDYSFNENDITDNNNNDDDDDDYSDDDVETYINDSNYNGYRENGSISDCNRHGKFRNLFLSCFKG